MTALIDSRAAIAAGATLGEGCRVGPFCVVGPHVVLGPRVTLHAHVVITGRTTMGPDTEVFPFAAIGHRPQDLKYRGEDSTVTVGAGCTLREGVTIHAGTAGGGHATTVGSRCTLLAHAHVAHDCRVGDDVILSNNVMLAGHVTVHDGAILAGGVGVHQFVRIGEGAFVGGLSGLEGDLVPFGLALGNRAHLAGLNLVGLRRRGASRGSIAALRASLSLLFNIVDDFSTRIEAVAAEHGSDPLVMKTVAFLRANGRRPLCRPAGMLS